MSMYSRDNITYGTSLSHGERSSSYDNYFDSKRPSQEEDKSTRYSCSDLDRRDAFGNLIKKGSKSFRVSFKDEMKDIHQDNKAKHEDNNGNSGGKPFVKVIKVPSLKVFNRLDDDKVENEVENNEEDSEDYGEDYNVISEDEDNDNEAGIDKDEGIFSSCLFM